ncbi:hypothetical protein, partial [Nitrolancea hollandica]|uniref:hypothetical protein n=1 Tax=Nitrolancea hollandica TaxID=1206749 RepID=UPI0005904FCC
YLAAATDRLFEGDDRVLRALSLNEKLVILCHLMIELLEMLEPDDHRYDTLIDDTLAWIERKAFPERVVSSTTRD